MTQRIETPPQEPSDPKRKASKVEARLDPELKKAAQEKAKANGWKLSSVIRALLRAWVEEGGPQASLTGVDVGHEDRQVTTHRKPKKNK